MLIFCQTIICKSPGKWILYACHIVNRYYFCTEYFMFKTCQVCQWLLIYRCRREKLRNLVASRCVEAFSFFICHLYRCQLEGSAFFYIFIFSNGSNILLKCGIHISNDLIQVYGESFLHDWSVKGWLGSFMASQSWMYHLSKTWYFTSKCVFRIYWYKHIVKYNLYFNS